MSTLDDAYVTSRLAARIRVEPAGDTAPPLGPLPQTFDRFEDLPDQANPGHILRYGYWPDGSALVYRGPAEQAPPLSEAGAPTAQPGTAPAAEPAPAAPAKSGGMLDALAGTARRMGEDLSLALSGQRAPADAAGGQVLAPAKAQAVWDEAGVNPDENLYAVQRDPADNKLKLFTRPQPLDQRDGAQVAEDDLRRDPAAGPGRRHR